MGVFLIDNKRGDTHNQSLLATISHYMANYFHMANY